MSRKTQHCSAKPGDPTAPRICRHIIKLEHLDAEFAPLMAKYDLEKVLTSEPPVPQSKLSVDT